jgi:ABC-2 type transport system ATP-binding protein
VIALEAASARRAPLAIDNVSLAWGPGIHALVGAPGDGGALLLAVVAGRVRARKGRVQVLEGGPTDAGVRERIAFVPLEPQLPEAMRVHDVLALAAAVRGDPALDPLERLATLGVEALGRRRTQTLSREEGRAVAMAEAMTSARVRVVLLEEPLVALDPRAAAKLPAALRDRARDGCSVVMATASVRDACELADDQALIHRGSVVGQATALDLLAGFAPHGARVRVVTSGARALLAALAREPEVDAVAHRDGAVVARGEDALAVARAAGRAVIASGVDVVEMRVEAPTVDEARAAATGVATATYDAAYERTRRALSPGSAGETGSAS